MREERRLRFLGKLLASYQEIFRMGKRLVKITGVKLCHLFDSFFSVPHELVVQMCRVCFQRLTNQLWDYNSGVSLCRLSNKRSGWLIAFDYLVFLKYRTCEELRSDAKTRGELVLSYGVLAIDLFQHCNPHCLRCFFPGFTAYFS